MNEQMSMFDDIIAESETVQDQTKETTSGERVLPAAGETIGRFVSYVELGPQMFSFKGKETGVAPAVSLGFELLHPVKNVKDGTHGQFITVPMKKISTHPKAGFLKLFKAMRYGREEIKHMAQMLADPFRIVIEHSECGKYANIQSVSRPFAMDLDTGEERPIRVMAFTRPIQFFMWNNPNKKCWDSIFIDGEYTKEDGTTVSKNWLQDRIKKSPAYPGSPVEVFLNGVITSNPDLDALGL